MKVVEGLGGGCVQGAYGKPLELPGAAGFEGCGVVVKNSGECTSWMPPGTRVAFRSFGTWADYCVAPVSARTSRPTVGSAGDCLSVRC